jgi:mannose-6-phosphate isomerase-like protein (cupin superfamily)
MAGGRGSRFAEAAGGDQRVPVQHRPGAAVADRGAREGGIAAAGEVVPWPLEPGGPGGERVGGASEAAGESVGDQVSGHRRSSLTGCSPRLAFNCADALGVDFGRLTQAQEPGALRTVRTADAAVAWSDDRGSEARLVLVSREPQSAELWHWLLKPGSRYQAKPDPEGTDVLIMVNRGTLTMTVDGQPSQLKPGTAGHITAGAGYLLANSGRADTAFTLVHIPPASMRARYTRAAARPHDNA